MVDDVLDFLLVNETEIKSQLKGNLERLIKNKGVFLPFEYKERFVDQVDKDLTNIISTVFKINVEESRVLLEDDKINKFLKHGFYDDFRYIG